MSRRSREQIYKDIQELCVKPHSVSEIIRKTNIDHTIFLDAVKTGVIEKIREETHWGGPPAHMYLNVHKKGRNEDVQT